MKRHSQSGHAYTTDPLGRSQKCTSELPTARRSIGGWDPHPGWGGPAKTTPRRSTAVVNRAPRQRSRHGVLPVARGRRSDVRSTSPSMAPLIGMNDRRQSASRQGMRRACGTNVPAQGRVSDAQSRQISWSRRRFSSRWAGCRCHQAGRRLELRGRRAAEDGPLPNDRRRRGQRQQPRRVHASPPRATFRSSCGCTAAGITRATSAASAASPHSSTRRAGCSTASINYQLHHHTRPKLRALSRSLRRRCRRSGVGQAAHRQVRGQMPRKSRSSVTPPEPTSYRTWQTIPPTSKYTGCCSRPSVVSDRSTPRVSTR